MLEARLAQASILKKLLDAIKELVTDANFECNEKGLELQAMDNSHVALVAVELKSDGFVKYRCDRPMPLGVNLTSLTKVLKCAKDDDIVTLSATENGDVLNLKYEAKNSDRIAEYEMKLMDIETDTLGIPDTDYDAKVYMPSAEFQRIVRDLTQLGESVRIDVSKEGVRFSSDGESANGSVLLKQTDAARNQFKREQEKEKEQARKAAKKEKAGKKKDDDEEMEEDDGGEIQEDGDEEKVKEEEEKDEEEKSDDDAEPEEEEDEDEDGETGKKRKRNGAGGGKGKKKAKKGEEEESQGGVSIQMSQSVQLSFSLKYLVNFAKSAGLSSHVELMMSPDVPLLVRFKFEQGSIQYYLAPKIGDD